MTGHLPKRSGGTRPNRRRARAAGTRRRQHPGQQRRRHADGALRLRPARGAPAHGRDQPARRDDGNGGLPRPAPRQCGGDLVNVSSVAGRVAPARLRRLRGDQVGDQRLVGGTARRAATRRPGHRHRARRHRDGTPRPHHPRRQQAGLQRPSTGPSRRTTSPTSSPSPSAARSA